MRAVPALVQIATRCGSTAAPVDTVCTYLPNLPWTGRVTVQGWGWGSVSPDLTACSLLSQQPTPSSLRPNSSGGLLLSIMSLHSHHTDTDC